MPAEITFPKIDPVWEFDRDLVRFFALRNGVVIPCNISAEALYFKFGARDFSESEGIRAFLENRFAIEETARARIENAPEPPDEVSLRTDDFASRPTKVTISDHVRFSSESPEIESDPELMRGVQNANEVLQRDLVRGDSRVRAEWNLIPANVPLVQLKLIDADNDLEVQSPPYTKKDLSNRSAVRFSLFRLWDDLLRERFREILRHGVFDGGSQ